MSESIKLGPCRVSGSEPELLTVPGTCWNRAALQTSGDASRTKSNAFQSAKGRGVPDDFLTRTKEPKPAGGTGQDESTGKT
ncbi:hypothetical protein KOW79_017079 [Hemibagrus wyckioides]|uniref:Uncharacterized protein n=1 Tax=Hemibagrus wyckioides TaxID=337641 RepID=A0A9D3NBY4_9TELE|nr:hypothetical protein KOW79_017079 [Hemibagrus wyckioides]